MKLFALTSATMIAMTTLLALAPAGSAVGWCSELLNRVNGDDCQHLVCYGRSTGTSYGYTWERCQLSEDDVPDPCGPSHCDPCRYTCGLVLLP